MHNLTCRKNSAGSSLKVFF